MVDVPKSGQVMKINSLCDLFQNCSSSTYGSMEMERTLAIIKPDGLIGNYTDDIKRTIVEYGFTIFKEKIVQLDQATVEKFYAEHSSKGFFSRLTKYMTRYEVSHSHEFLMYDDGILCFLSCYVHLTLPMFVVLPKL